MRQLTHLVHAHSRSLFQFTVTGCHQTAIVSGHTRFKPKRTPPPLMGVRLFLIGQRSWKRRAGLDSLSVRGMAALPSPALFGFSSFRKRLRLIIRTLVN